MNLPSKFEKSLIINISPPKCGTTSVYSWLISSGDVNAPRIKEPRFFSRGLDDLYNDLPSGLRPSGNYSHGIQWFENLFSGDGKYCIDFTTYYSVLPDVTSLVKLNFSQPKAICILREPVDRFISHYYQYVKVGVKVPPLDDVIAGSTDFSRFMLEFSNYEENITRFIDAFGADSVLILNFQDVVSTPDRVCDCLMDFLEVQGVKADASNKAVNPSGEPKIRIIQQLLISSKFRQIASRISPELKTCLLNFRKSALRMNTSDTAYPALTDRQRDLLAERLSDSVRFYSRLFEVVTV